MEIFRNGGGDPTVIGHQVFVRLIFFRHPYWPQGGGPKRAQIGGIISLREIQITLAHCFQNSPNTVEGEGEFKLRFPLKHKFNFAIDTCLPHSKFEIVIFRLIDLVIFV